MLDRKIKKSFACRSVTGFTIDSDLSPYYSPKAGDVGIFKVRNPSGNMLMDAQGIAHHLFEGDLIMAAYGNRYATNQYEGYVPTKPISTCELIARGGVVGCLSSVNLTFKGTPASLELVGYAIDKNKKVINTIQRHKLFTFNPHTFIPKVILSVGSSMDSGKTTTAAYLCGSLKSAGHRVSYIKLTGTAFPKDARLAEDKGADMAIDFSHFGYPSTYLMDYEELLDLYQSLVNEVMTKTQAEYIVIEIADGLLQRETNMLLKDTNFIKTIHSVIFSSGDSLGVLTGLQMLNDWGCFPFAVSGLFTSSELLIREVEPFIDAPILRLSDFISDKAVESLKIYDCTFNSKDPLLAKVRA